MAVEQESRLEEVNGGFQWSLNEGLTELPPEGRSAVLKTQEQGESTHFYRPQSSQLNAASHDSQTARLETKGR